MQPCQGWAKDFIPQIRPINWILLILFTWAILLNIKIYILSMNKTTTIKHRTTINKRKNIKW